MLKTSTHNTIQTVDIEIIAFIVKKINYAYLVTICLKHCAFSLWYFAIARSTAQTSARNACFWFVVFRYRSYQYKKLGTSIVPFYKQKQTFLRCKVCSMFVVLRYRSFHGTNFGTQRVLVFLYPFQRLRKRKLNGYKKPSAYIVCTQRSLWSE